MPWWASETPGAWCSYAASTSSAITVPRVDWEEHDEQAVWEEIDD
jgi:hypothetical protein